MLEFGPTFIWVAVNLAVLYIVLRIILFKPVTQFMDNRSKSIKDSIEEAERSKAEAMKLKQSYEEQIRSARDEADKILNDARARAGREYDRVIEAAKADAQALMVKAREEMELEKEQTMKDIKSHVAGLALAAASKVIEANMDNEKNRSIVDKFIDEAGAA